MQFNSIYGEDANDVDHWLRLSDVLGITPAPEGLEACREVSASLRLTNAKDSTYFSCLGGWECTRQYC
jgi:hypothetical protein